MVLFRDVNKASADVINRDFTHNVPIDLEVKSAAAPFSFTQCATITSAVAANSTVRFADKAFSAEGKFFTNGNSTFDLKYTKADFYKGTLLLNGRVDKKGTAFTPEVAADFSMKSAHAKFSLFPTSMTFNGSALFCLSKFKLGAEAAGSCDLSKVTFGLGGNYSNGPMTFSVKTAPAGGTSLGKVIGNVHAKKDSVEIGAEMSYGLTDSKTSLAFGGRMQVNKETAVKAKLADDGKVAMSLSHTFSPLISATMGAQFDGLNLGNSEALKYGAKVTFNC
uniref:Uncharacterized protein n=1 Tax=Chromera velia CCMP2878 TaxID=1169474 RepID=A0A0G4F9M1_9ALVE|eukprot:Cvel_2962.t1-p1 / transcript=Cvel_2962.t1 / gene=Cvel_2962 / organism=Chromera_velia_CCMP2878 / gene_product=Mitochondrial outer membrane protein porin, putative / transcript_product=Mitochondrial outer membrane protein porin, putative / location=Cvel_scaffold117:72132-75411(+) / protein_length=277 / sequence_SO=supercontig / SO=protein_coding / is_pseudo=false